MSPSTTQRLRPAGSVDTALSAAMDSARLWQGVSVALGVVSLWLGVTALRESRAHRAAVDAADKSRRARIAALETLRA